MAGKKGKRGANGKKGTAKARAHAVAAIEQLEHFSAPPETIYRVWLDAAHHAAFTGSPATSDPRPGGIFSAWDGYIQGRHLELVESERIVQSWRAADFPPGSPDSRLEIRLTPESGGTRLELRHTSVPKKNAASYAEGWHEHYWRPLRAYLAERS
jgi:uncharacterized protein YndB with AHSA1/START domain